MKIGIAYPAFFEDFRFFFPEIEVIKSPNTINEYDLVVFSGGADISPSIYGEQIMPMTSFNEIRDVVELRILERALKFNKKILGICRGHQLINAYLGGKLIQNISPPHLQWHKTLWDSDLDAFQKTLFDHYNTHHKLWVNSYHHQAIKSLGTGMKIICRNPVDNIIEATGNGDNILTVQWHPEFSNDFVFFDIIKKWLK